MMPEKYWSEFFGLTIAQLKTAGPKVVSHQELNGYNGAWIFQIQKSIIISVPSKIHFEIESKVSSCDIETDFLSPKFATLLFEEIERIERIIGPCYQGICTHETLKSFESNNTRLIESSEYLLLKRLQQSVNEEAWDHSSISADKVNFGYFENGELCAAACLDMWNDKVANIGLLTHPAHSRKGYAKELCSFATRFGLEKGYEMVYQTLLSNEPAVAVARSTGYIEYANHLAIRFKSPQV